MSNSSQSRISAYLDNNVIVDIEQGNTTLAQVIENIDPKIEAVYFSSAHIQELEEITGSTDNEKLERINRRLSTIEIIAQNNYLYSTLDNEVFFKLESPRTVLETIREVPADGFIKVFMSIVSEAQKQQFRDALGVNPKLINNYKPDEVIDQLNVKLVMLGNMSFTELIEYSISLNPQGSTFGISHRIGAMFEMLDMIGYWKDKFTGNSNYARLWDSNHTFFAAHCNYFVSDDKRTRNKARVVYHQFGVGTKVLSCKGKE